MKKNKSILLFLTASATLISSLCLAQEAPVGMSVNRPADGSVNVQITNHHQSALTAYILEVDRASATGSEPNGRGTLYFDSLLNPWQNKSFAPGETRTIRVAGPSRGPTTLQVEPKLKATIFEDGTTTGDSETVARVLAARKSFFNELGKAILLIQTAQATGMSREDLIEEAGQQWHTDIAGAQYPEEKRAVANPWGTLQGNLQHNSTLPVGNVEQNVLQLFMRLRQALMLSKPAVTLPAATVSPSK